MNALSRLCSKSIEGSVLSCNRKVIRQERKTYGRKMRVVEIETQDLQRRYVVIDDEGNLVEPVVRYLKYLDQRGAARQTIRSYASMLRLYWEFLSQQRLEWQQITLEDLAEFVFWLKLPTGSLT